ncbi:MAG: hypothetical protein Q9191_001803 [Dirinaria sp. TL-2023a]
MVGSASPPAGGDQNAGRTINAVNWTFTTIAILAVTGRIIGRLALTHNIGWDDFWILVSLLFSISYTAIESVSIAFGGGRHVYYLAPESLSNAIKFNTIAYVPGIISVGLPKLAVAILLMRLLNIDRRQRILMYCLSIGSIILQTLCVVFFYAQCKPAAGLWDPSLKPACWSPSVLVNFAYFAGAYSALVDFYLALYPTTVLFQLKINMKKKIGLSCVMGIGVIAGAVAIYKCATLHELEEHADYTYIEGEAAARRRRPKHSHSDYYSTTLATAGSYGQIEGDSMELRAPPKRESQTEIRRTIDINVESNRDSRAAEAKMRGWS